MKLCTKTGICGATLAAAMGLTASNAQADWTGKGEAGLVIASGNTETKTVSAKLGLVDTFDPWKFAYDLSAIKASTSGLETIERYTAGEQTNYKIDEHSFLFGALDYKDDKFSGFLYQADAMAGYGYQFYDTKKIKLSVQAGAGYRKSKDDLGHDSQGKAVGTAGMNYENAITDTTKVLDKFTVVSGSDNTQMHNFLGLEVKMSTKLALSVGLDVQRNSHPPVPKKPTDELTTVAIVYAF
jgi:putative salt-induced outer membrane protein